jgi:hypothetical protein
VCARRTVIGPVIPPSCCACVARFLLRVPYTHTPGLRLEFQTVHELNGCRGMCSIARCPLYVQCQSWAPDQHIQAACWVNNPCVAWDGAFAPSRPAAVNRLRWLAASGCIRAQQ